ncbi:MAG: hypothetical protein AB1689_01005 [Thermodesulfobacteriota bacterium]
MTRSSRVLLAILVLGAASRADAGSELADVTQIGADRMGPTDVILDYPPNPIPAELFASPDYVPPPGYLKNTPRTAQFDAEETLSSPGEPEGVVTVVTTPDGFTWKRIARTLSANWPYDPDQYATLDPPPLNAWDAAFRSPTPPAGVVRYSANEKNQLMTFFATDGDAPEGEPILRYFVEDVWGNRYMMMATGAASVEETIADFEAAVLPAGWRRWTGYLPETVTLVPAYGAGNQAQYNIWRDSADSTFVQIRWSASGHGIAEQIAGMPIWGGRGNDRVLGTPGDDVVHGADGHDTLLPLAGDDEVYGDAGVDTVAFAGSSWQYAVTAQSEDGTFVELQAADGTKALHDVEYVRFANRTCVVAPRWRCTTSAVRRPTASLLPWMPGS